MRLLSEKVVLVTGATQGLGAGIARCAAQHGASVVVAGRDASRGEAVAAEIGGVFVAGDVGIPAQATGLVEATVARFGRIDGLVNSAGLTSRGTLLDTTPELFDEHIAVNLRGPFFTMQAAVADMTRRGAPGAIVNIITMSSHGGQAFLAPYSTSKAGLVGLTKNAAHAHRFYRIRINGLNIGWTATDGEDAIQRSAHGRSDGWLEEAQAALPMGKLGQVDEIAEMVVFLLSDRSGVVTGSVIDWDQIVIGGLD